MTMALKSFCFLRGYNPTHHDPLIKSDSGPRVSTLTEELIEKGDDLKTSALYSNTDLGSSTKKRKENSKGVQGSKNYNTAV